MSNYTCYLDPALLKLTKTVSSLKSNLQKPKQKQDWLRQICKLTKMQTMLNQKFKNKTLKKYNYHQRKKKQQNEIDRSSIEQNGDQFGLNLAGQQRKRKYQIPNKQKQKSKSKQKPKPKSKSKQKKKGKYPQRNLNIFDSEDKNQTEKQKIQQRKPAKIKINQKLSLMIFIKKNRMTSIYKKIYNDNDDQQTRKSVQGYNFFGNQVSPSQFNLQNERFQQSQFSNDIPIIPIVVVDQDENLNKVDGEKNQDDGFEQEQYQPHMRRYKSNRNIDQDSVLSKKLNKDRIKELEKIYLPSLEVIKPKRKKNECHHLENKLIMVYCDLCTNTLQLNIKLQSFLASQKNQQQI